MTDQPAPARSPLLWLLPAVVAAIGGGVWLWQLAQPRACILIYPAPPGCNSLIPYWLPFVGIALVALLLVAMIVVAFRAPKTRTLIAFLIAILAVVVVFVAIMYLAFAGVFDAPQPPV